MILTMTKSLENLLRESTLSLLSIAKTFFILHSLNNCKILFYTFFETAFIFHCPMKQGTSEQASKKTSERSGAHKQSEQSGSPKQVSRASVRASGQ